MTDSCTKHKAHTDKIITAETRINAIVYALFDLTSDEIKRIEDSTKYEYGTV